MGRPVTWIRSLPGIEYRFGQSPLDCGRGLISGKRPINRDRPPLATRRAQFREWSMEPVRAIARHPGHHALDLIGLGPCLGRDDPRQSFDLCHMMFRRNAPLLPIGTPIPGFGTPGCF